MSQLSNAPSPSVSVSGTPHPQWPGADLPASMGHRSTQSAVPSWSVSVSGKLHPHAPGSSFDSSLGQYVHLLSLARGDAPWGQTHEPLIATYVSGQVLQVPLTNTDVLLHWHTPVTFAWVAGHTQVLFACTNVAGHSQAPVALTNGATHAELFVATVAVSTGREHTRQGSTRTNGAW